MIVTKQTIRFTVKNKSNANPKHNVSNYNICKALL